jgi:hypothetical protein
VWFSELAGLAVGRVETTGQLVEYPVPGPFSGIAGISAGPDGNLWYTRNDTDRIGAVDTAGVLQVELQLAAGARPLSICLGPDGNLWFTEADANAIGRVELAQPGTVHVLSMDAAFAPRRQTAKLGESVQWTFLGPNVHSVVDGSGLDLFDSGPHGHVEYFVLGFDSAGTFVYHDGAGSSFGGSVGVPVALPGSAQVGVPFDVTWALAAPPAGLVFDVQVSEPGAGGFTAWTTSSGTSQSYTPLAAGRYRFRARLRDTVGGKTTRYSPPASIGAH